MVRNNFEGFELMGRCLARDKAKRFWVAPLSYLSSSEQMNGRIQLASSFFFVCQFYQVIIIKFCWLASKFYFSRHKAFWLDVMIQYSITHRNLSKIDTCLKYVAPIVDKWIKFTVCDNFYMALTLFCCPALYVHCVKLFLEYEF